MSTSRVFSKFEQSAFEQTKVELALQEAKDSKDAKEPKDSKINIHIEPPSWHPDCGKYVKSTNPLLAKFRIDRDKRMGVHPDPDDVAIVRSMKAKR